MSNWNEIYEEVEDTARSAKNPHDSVRHRYLKAFAERTERNVIAYYSGWLQKTDYRYNNIVGISDEDKNGFMACFYGLDFTKGLDIFLHSPGGSVAATESIIHYITAKFGSDIRVFVPQISMSGGTMMALMGKEIWMGAHSNLGPIDPQFGPQPAQLVLSEFDEALKQIKADPDKIEVWRPILEQIPPTFISSCEHAIEWSKEIGEKSLKNAMFKDDPEKDEKAKNIIEELADASGNKSHGRHIHRDECEGMGLKVVNFESDQDMQNAIMCVHHSYMISLMNTPMVKIIENQSGTSHIKDAASTSDSKLL